MATSAAPPVQKPCTVCEGPAHLMAARLQGSLYRCERCDHCFSGLETMPEQEIYDDYYFNVKHRAYFAHPDLALYDRVLREIQAFKPGASVIDVGAGRGALLKHLRAKDKSLRLTGIDVAPIPPIEGVELIQGDALELKLTRRFDVVVSLSVIEHVLDIQTFAAGHRDLCAPGGRVIVTTVNDRSVLYGTARLMRGLGLREPFDRLYEMHHLNHFNLSSLRRLLERNGLTVLRTYLHNTPMAAVDTDQKAPLKGAVFKAGVWGTFVLGKLLGRTYFQTVVCMPAAG